MMNRSNKLDRERRTAEQEEQHVKWLSRRNELDRDKEKSSMGN